MTTSGKTRKDQKEVKERNEAYRAKRSLHREERGGHKNLVKEAREELMEEATEDSLERE